MLPVSVNRRDFLSSALLLPTLFTQSSSARFISAVPLGNPGGLPTPPFGVLLGAGLDARLFTDLSLLGGPAGDPRFPVRNPQSAIRDSDSASLVTPSDRFFVRTAVPSTLTRTEAWAIRVGGRVHTPVDLDSEKALDAELKSWMAFAKQKLSEVTVLAKAAGGQKEDRKSVV